MLTLKNVFFLTLGFDYFYESVIIIRSNRSSYGTEINEKNI